MLIFYDNRDLLRSKREKQIPQTESILPHLCHLVMLSEHCPSEEGYLVLGVGEQ